MGHLKFGPLNLGHGPVEEAGAVIDPTRSASQQTETNLRTTGDPTLTAAFVGSDVAKGYLKDRNDPPGEGTPALERIADADDRSGGEIRTIAWDEATPETPELPGLGRLRLLVGVIVAALLAVAFGQLFNINIGD